MWTCRVVERIVPVGVGRSPLLWAPFPTWLCIHVGVGERTPPTMPHGLASTFTWALGFTYRTEPRKARAQRTVTARSEHTEYHVKAIAKR